MHLTFQPNRWELTLKLVKILTLVCEVRSINVENRVKLICKRNDMLLAFNVTVRGNSHRS
ncbi:MAG: hypothetical protein ACTS4U_01520 [Candidatus Hodgkinia cicadicola]